MYIVTGSGRADLHFVDALLRLADAPELVLFGASKPDIGPSVRSVPAALSVLIAQDHTVTLSKALAVNALLLVGKFLVNTDKVAHVGVAVALLALLRGAIHPAQLILILADISADTPTLDGAEDAIRAVVLFKIALLLLERGGLLSEFVLGTLKSLPGCDDQARLAAGGRVVSEKAVLDQPDAEEVDLVMNVVARKAGKISLQIVDCSS